MGRKNNFSYSQKLFSTYFIRERKEMFSMSFPNYSSQTGEAKTSPESLFTGKGIGIAFLDTGISPVADFITPQNRIVVFRDFVSGKIEPYDDNGHGTHVT
jgi:serine protease AprX